MLKKIVLSLLLAWTMFPVANLWADTTPPSGPQSRPSSAPPDQPVDQPLNFQVPEAPIVPSIPDILNQAPVPPSPPVSPKGGGPTSGPSSGPSSGPTGGGAAQPSGGTATSTIKLDGVDMDAKVTKETTSEGQSVVKVTLDADKLGKAFSSAQSPVITLEIKNSDPVVKVVFPAASLMDALSKQPTATIQIKVDGASYTLPASVLKNVPKDAVITVTITKVSGKTSADVNAAVQRQGLQQLLDNPIDYSVSSNGQEVTDFNGTYVDRTITLKSTTDSSKATAVWVDTNNNLHFIPSFITSSNGSALVAIHSPHNSLYTVIQSDKTFVDLKGHWAKADVELLANKLVVNGVTETSFAPDSKITRAEFAALLVRSLGLVEDNAEGSPFTDVLATDWYLGAVVAAQKASLIGGYEDGTFRPNENITREQMVSMIARALKVGGKETKADVLTLDQFTDRSTIADWAKDAAVQSLTAHIILGTSETTFAAKENASRAQSATMLKRMLQYLQFIN